MAKWLAFETGAERNAHPDAKASGTAVYVNEWGARQYWADGWQQMGEPVPPVYLPSGQPLPPVPSPTPVNLFRMPYNKDSMYHRMLGQIEFGIPPSVPKGKEGTNSYSGGVKNSRGSLSRMKTLRLGTAPVGRKGWWEIPAGCQKKTIKYNKPSPGQVTLMVPPPGPDCYYLEGDGDFQVLFYSRDCNGIWADTFTNFDYKAGTAEVYKYWKLDGGDVWDDDARNDGGQDGTSASNVRLSCLRGFQVNPSGPLPPINNSLHMTVTRRDAPANCQVLGKNSVWPAYGQDGSSQDKNNNGGDCPYGMLSTFKPDEFLDILARIPENNHRGRAVVTALGKRGIYILDGNSAQVNGAGVGQIRCDSRVGFNANGSSIGGVIDDIDSALALVVNDLHPVYNVPKYGDKTRYSDGFMYIGNGPALYPDSPCVAWDA